MLHPSAALSGGAGIHHQQPHDGYPSPGITSPRPKTPSSAGRVGDQGSAQKLFKAWKDDRNRNTERDRLDRPPMSGPQGNRSMMDMSMGYGGAGAGGYSGYGGYSGGAEAGYGDEDTSFLNASYVPEVLTQVKDRHNLSSVDYLRVMGPSGRLATHKDTRTGEEVMPGLAHHLQKSTDACMKWMANTVLKHVVDILKPSAEFLQSERFRVCVELIQRAGHPLQCRYEYDLLGAEDKNDVDRINNAFNSVVQQHEQEADAFFRQQGIELARVKRDMDGIRLCYDKYLSVHESRKYVGQRIRTLMEDQCASFIFNGGETRNTTRSRNGDPYYVPPQGNIVEKDQDGSPFIPWTDGDCPPDAQILMHCFCAYMDEKAYSDSGGVNLYPGTTSYSLPVDFTHLHFIKEKDIARLKDRRPGSANSDQYSDVYIYQESIRPPEYKILKGIEPQLDHNQVADPNQAAFEKWNLLDKDPHGTPYRVDPNHNLFHAIVTFLYIICNEKEGRLAEANVTLEPSGLDIRRNLRFESLPQQRTSAFGIPRFYGLGSPLGGSRAAGPNYKEIGI